MKKTFAAQAGTKAIWASCRRNSLPPSPNCATTQGMNTVKPLACNRDNLPVDLLFVQPRAREYYRKHLAPATAGSAGFDLCACLDVAEKHIPAGERLCVGTGISIQPRVAGIAAFVYSRSGLGARKGLVVAQGVGVIDPDYTGEILVYLLNTSKEQRSIRNGERIAQLIFQSYMRPQWREVKKLAPTERGSGGFGHTGR